MHLINLAFLHLYFLSLFNLDYVDVHDGLSLYHMNINPLRIVLPHRLTRKNKSSKLHP